MLEMPDNVVKWLAHSALGGGLLLLLGVLLMRLTPRPARRQRLGELALLSSLLVAGLCLFPAYVPWALPLLPAETEPLPAPAPPAQRPTETLEVFIGPALVMQTDPLGRNVAVPLEWLDAPAEAMPANRPPAGGFVALDMPRHDSSRLPDDGPLMGDGSSGSSFWSWPSLLPWFGAAYLVIAVGLLARCLIGHVGLHRLVRASVPPSPEVERLFEALTRGWKERPRLRICQWVSMPVSFGLRRPTILLPPAVCRPEAQEELRLALVHELTHLERRDAWSCLLSALGQAVYFYLPWLWWLRRQLRLCQEYVADAAAAALTRSEDYAQYLLSLAPQARALRSLGSAKATRLAGIHAQGIWGNSSDLFRRITMLLDSRRSVERSVPRWWSLAAGAGFLVAAVLISGISLQARADDKKEPVAEKKSDKAKKDAAREHLKEALKAYEALVGEKSDLSEKQLRDALKLYEALIVDEKGDDAKKKAVARVKAQADKADEEVKKHAIDAAKIHADVIRKQAEMQLKLAEAQLKAAQAQLEQARKAAENATQKVQVELEKAFKDADEKLKDGKKDLKEATKWKLDVRPEFFENQIRLAPNAQLQFRNWDPKMGLFKQSGGRLGVRVETPAEALTEQLNLAKEQGLLVQDVVANSAAAKAGVQKHDIILFFGDQPVTHDHEKFITAVRDGKAGEIELVVLRKGKRVTLRATLPEAKKGEVKLEDNVVPFKFNRAVPFKDFQGAIILDPTTGQPNLPFWTGQNIFVNPNARSVTTTIIRKNDQFTTRHQEDALVISITGSIEDGKVKVKEIGVHDGGAEKKYESLDKVPDQHKDKVKHLLEQTESGQVKVKVKSSR